MSRVRISFIFDIALKTSQRGNDYDTFKLCDKVCVRVFTWGHPKLNEGLSETVHGTFAPLNTWDRTRSTMRLKRTRLGAPSVAEVSWANSFISGAPVANTTPSYTQPMANAVAAI